jgi:hypothetical protein
MELAVPLARGSEPGTGGPSLMNHRIVPVGRNTVVQVTLPGEDSSTCGNPYSALFWASINNGTVRPIIYHIHLNLCQNLQWRVEN